MKLPYKLALALGSVGLVAGVAATVALQSHAATTNGASSNAAPGTQQMRMHGGHAPLGGDGNVVSINGTTIVMQEESEEGGASYTVDASNATFKKNGATATIADIKVGDKIFVQGTTSGTSVAATSISDGFPGSKPGMMGHFGG